MRISTLFSAALATSLTIFTLTAPAADKDKDQAKHMAAHNDPYVRGPANESDLVKEVRHHLLMLPYYGVFDDLGFNVNGGTVTLMGEVTRPTLKDDAASTVKKISGVTNVVNNIEVLPLSATDDGARMAIFRKIYGDQSLSTRYAYSATPSIHIIVKNGNVRLEGVVANEMDKNIAGIRAKEVGGVFSVENDLQIEGRG